MKLALIRDILADGFTLGTISIEGKHFCYTCEDKVRTVKIPGETAIPSGTYKVILSFSNRFKKVLPLLLNVPYFEGIRIHSGNTSKDTEGCILVGLTRTENGVGRSRDAMAELMALLAAEHESGKSTEIEVI